MAKTLTITFTPPSGTHSYITKYRVAGSGAPYTQVYPNATSTPIVIPGLLDSTNYEGTIQTVCSEGVSSTIAWYATAAGCTCTSGYTASPDGTYCYKELVEPATVSGGSTVLACHYKNVVYTSYGTIFHQPGGYNVDGTYTITPTFLKTAVVGGSYTGDLWGNYLSTISAGRLNKTGIWSCIDVNYNTTALGFTRQIIIPTTKVYYVGMGADNYATIKVNGTTIVQQNAVNIGTQLSAGIESAFKYWHVYPVLLTSGINLLQITGTNTSGPGIFGCEIYDATEAQLISCVTESDLIPYLVFTTADIPSLPPSSIVAENDPFEVGNYNCDAHPGYSLLYDGEAYICKKIDSISCI